MARCELPPRNSIWNKLWLSMKLHWKRLCSLIFDYFQEHAIPAELLASRRRHSAELEFNRWFVHSSCNIEIEQYYCICAIFMRRNKYKYWVTITMQHCHYKCFSTRFFVFESLQWLILFVPRTKWEKRLFWGVGDKCEKLDKMAHKRLQAFVWKNWVKSKFSSKQFSNSRLSFHNHYQI